MRKFAFVILALFVLLTLTQNTFAETDSEYDIALKFYYSGKYEQAVRLLKDYVQKKPEPSAYYRIGYALYKLGRHDEATEFFKEAYLVDPNFSPSPPAVTQPLQEEKVEEVTIPYVEPLPLITEPSVAESKEGQVLSGVQEEKRQEPAVTPEEKVPMPFPQEVAPGKMFQPPQEFSQMPLPQQEMPGFVSALMALSAGLGIIMLLIDVAIYVYYSLCNFLIGKKLEVPNSWMAWVPILQVYWPFVGAAGKPWTTALFLFLAPLLGGILAAIMATISIGMVVFLMLIIGIGFLIYYIYLWMCITENLGKNKWLALLMIVPIANLVFIGILAFSKTEASGYTMESAPVT